MRVRVRARVRLGEIDDDKVDAFVGGGVELASEARCGAEEDESLHVVAVRARARVRVRVRARARVGSEEWGVSEE